jgi:hypothetical protein
MNGRVDPKFIDLVVELRRAGDDLLEKDSEKNRRALRDLGLQVDKWIADYLADLRKWERWSGKRVN